MFDIDQDVEILNVIQAVHKFLLDDNFIYRTSLEEALNEIIEKYGEEILTYTGV